MAFDSIKRLESVPAPSSKTVLKQSSAFAGLRAETLLRRLEPRIMFDAAAVATAIEALHIDPHTFDQHDSATPAADAHATETGAGVAAQSGFGGLEIAGLGAHMDGPVVIQGDASAKTIVFIDANVEDAAAIEKAIATDAEIVMLDPGKDGLNQIANFLQGRSGLDAIHIVSHGEAGKLHLGSSVYDTATLKAFDTELDAIGEALHTGGDILIYGCDVAKGASGDAFVHKFADLTHVNVAASTGLTGAATSGGNWVLEDKVGAVHTAAIVATSWQHELTTNTVANGSDLIIKVQGTPDVVVGNDTGIGSYAIWHNAGTTGGVTFDLKATVVGGTGTIDFTRDLTGQGYSANDPTLVLSTANATASVKWEVLQAGTSVALHGNAHLSIGDIDGTDIGESVTFDRSVVSSYRLNSGTVLSVTDNGTTLKAASTITGNTNNLPNQRAMFDLDGVSSWTVKYTSVIAGRGYVMDGNFERRCFALMWEHGDSRWIVLGDGRDGERLRKTAGRDRGADAGA